LMIEMGAVTTAGLSAFDVARTSRVVRCEDATVVRPVPRYLARCSRNI
jgi:hypothetical protein